MAASELSRLQSPAAVQLALNEFANVGRTAFLERYGFGKSRDFLVRNPGSGELCDSKAIVGAAYGYQYPEEGPMPHTSCWTRFFPVQLKNLKEEKTSVWSTD